MCLLIEENGGGDFLCDIALYILHIPNADILDCQYMLLC